MHTQTNDTPKSSSSSHKQGRKFSKKIILTSIIVGVLLLIGGVVAAFTKINGGVKLVKYSDDNVEILYPENYKKKTIPGEGVQFTEDAPKDSKDKSVIIVDTGDTGNVDDGKKSQFFDEFEQGLLKEKFTTFVDKGYPVVDKSERIKHKGNEAIRLKGTYKVDGKKVGDITAIAALTQNKYYTIVVAAHDSDPGVQKKAHTIIDSISVK